MRPLFVLIHRYLGLAMAGFLVIAGLSGALLAFEHELDTAINSRLMRVERPAPGAAPMDALTVRERVQAHYPEARVHRVDLAVEPGEALSFRIGRSAGTSGNDQVFVNPYTGEILGERKWGDIGQGWTNLMPFIYRLHQSLTLDGTGTLVLGIVSLAWFLDCFVGAYLTFPARRKMPHNQALSPPTGRGGIRGWHAGGRHGKFAGSAAPASATSICTVPEVCGCGRCWRYWPGPASAST